MGVYALEDAPIALAEVSDRGARFIALRGRLRTGGPWTPLRPDGIAVPRYRGRMVSGSRRDVERASPHKELANGRVVGDKEPSRKQSPGEYQKPVKEAKTKAATFRDSERSRLRDWLWAAQNKEQRFGYVAFMAMPVPGLQHHILI